MSNLCYSSTTLIGLVSYKMVGEPRTPHPGCGPLFEISQALSRLLCLFLFFASTPALPSSHHVHLKRQEGRCGTAPCGNIMYFPLEGQGPVRAQSNLNRPSLLRTPISSISTSIAAKPTLCQMHALLRLSETWRLNLCLIFPRPHPIHHHAESHHSAPVVLQTLGKLLRMMGAEVGVGTRVKTQHRDRKLVFRLTQHSRKTTGRHATVLLACFIGHEVCMFMPLPERPEAIPSTRAPWLVIQ